MNFFFVGGLAIVGIIGAVYNKFLISDASRFNNMVNSLEYFYNNFDVMTVDSKQVGIYQVRSKDRRPAVSNALVFTSDTKMFSFETFDLVDSGCTEPQGLIIHSTQTAYARISFASDTEYFGDGVCLLIDGIMQSCSGDEFIYHESLVQPAALLLPEPPKSALVIGGAEGATVRELLKFPSIKTIVFVDIDAELVDNCKNYLPDSYRTGYDIFDYESRVETHWVDIREFLKTETRKFDIILGDITDGCHPMTGSFYSDIWLKQIAKFLTPNGAFATHAGPVRDDTFFDVISGARNVFSHVYPYVATVDSFRALWGFVMATNAKTDFLMKSPTEIDSKLTKLLDSRAINKFYDGFSHSAMFHGIPKHIRGRINNL